jgi:hypothetical protein
MRWESDGELQVIQVTGRQLDTKSIAHFLRAAKRSLLVGAVAGVFLAITGAFGTHEASLLNRLTFWVPVLLAGSICAVGLGRIAAKRPDLGERRLQKWLVIVVSIAAPMTLLSWGLARLVFGHAGPSSPLYFGWATTIITSAMATLMMTLHTPGVATSARNSNNEQIQIRLLERLAPAQRNAAVYAVSAEDHYLRVHTSNSSTLIYLRLADAIAELDGIEGAQVHRSWWVARSAICRTRRDKRRIFLILTNGQEVPVSRPNVVALRAAGWI